MKSPNNDHLASMSYRLLWALYNVRPKGIHDWPRRRKEEIVYKGINMGTIIEE